MLKLLARSLVPDGTQKELIALLHSLDLSDKEIAQIVGTTPGTVSTTLSKLRKESKR